MRQRGHFHIFVGLAFITWGVAAVMDNFGFIGLAGLFRLYWPALLLFWGGGMLLFGQAEQRFFGAVVTAVGVLFLGRQLWGWSLNVGALIWPAILFFIGLRIIMGNGPWGGNPAWRASQRARRAAWKASRAAQRASWHTTHAAHRATAEFSAGGLHESPDEPDTVDTTATQAPPDDADAPPGDQRTDPSATFREFAFLGGIERRNTSQAFRGGSATAFLGGIEIDLRECRMAEGGAQIDVFAMMGGVSLRIPRDWTVDSEVSAILGGFQDHSAPPVGSEIKRLVITGQAVMGGVEIKN